jgi:hypothetical protein
MIPTRIHTARGEVEYAAMGEPGPVVFAPDGAMGESDQSAILAVGSPDVPRPPLAFDLMMWLARQRWLWPRHARCSRSTKGSLARSRCRCSGHS